MMKLSELSIDEQRNFKKLLNLPIKKQIVYYNQYEYQKYRAQLVLDIEIIKELPSSSILKIYLDNGDSKSIMSDYLSEMNKANFLELIKQSEQS